MTEARESGAKAGRTLNAVDYRDKPHRRWGDTRNPRLSGACFAPQQLGVWLGLGVLSLLWLLPVRVRDRLGSALGRLHYRFGRTHYRAARRNLRLCFPGRSAGDIDELLREHSATQWCVWLDLPALWMRSPRALCERTDFHGLDTLQSRAAQGQATVLLVCHNVALEHAAQILKTGLPMLGYYRQFKSPVLDWLFYRLRSRNGGYLSERQAPLRALLRDVRDGWQLYQMIDEDLGADAGEFAPFFATDFCAVTGSARMCGVAGADAVPVCSGYDRARHRYWVSVLDPLVDFPTGSAASDARALMATLEALISVSPAQFMWRQRMLHTRPDGAESPYFGIRSATD
ncbi:MAG: hypothetical protein AAF460_02415 [Pseudomonadota bacterium]